MGAVVLSRKRPDLSDCELERLLGVTRLSAQIPQHHGRAQELAAKPEAALQPLVQPAWHHTPRVVGLSVISVDRRSDGNFDRVLRASTASESGNFDHDITVNYEPSKSEAW